MTVGKTIEMINEGAVAGFVVVDGDLVMTEDCTVDMGPKMTRKTMC